MTGTSIEFFVAGEPIPQGSSKGFPVKRANGKIGVAITHANPRTMDWRRRIADEAQKANVDGFYVSKNNGVGDGVRVVAIFYLPKPKSAKKNAVPSKKPDADKLIRSGLDALTGILFDDDSQVIELMVRKRYVPESEGPGVNVKVEAI